MKDYLQQIIDNMQAEIDRHKANLDDKLSSVDEAFGDGYAAACSDYIQDLHELLEMCDK